MKDDIGYSFEVILDDHVDSFKIREIIVLVDDIRIGYTGELNMSHVQKLAEYHASCFVEHVKQKQSFMNKEKEKHRQNNN